MWIHVLQFEPPHEKNNNLHFMICENKGAVQLFSNFTADQHIRFHYTDCIVSLFIKAEISNF